MLQRVMLDGIELPRLYIAENKADVELAMSKGIPFVRWTKGQEALIRMLLRPVLERMFPHINWNKVLGPKPRFRTKVEMCAADDVTVTNHNDDGATDSNAYDEGDGMMTEVADVAEGVRTFDLASSTERMESLSIYDYVGDMSAYVNIDVLQRLRLMPAFIGDILDCVRLNVGSGMMWREGYNKRLGLAVGRYDTSGQLPNLIILDVSASIPRGISATMISLIDTLRTQLTADLIITARRSRFYAMGDELPDPDNIRRIFPLGNESAEFINILNDRIQGRHYGHVFSFGDNDSPSYEHISLPDTKVEHVHHYHTWGADIKTGYAKWCHMLATQPEADFDNSWCKVIRQ